MFQNPNGEKSLCDILKAFVEEHLGENVTVTVPEDWKQHSVGGLGGKVKLEFHNKKSVVISVKYDTVSLVYEEPLV
jgi:hypothetical protein